MVFAFAIADDCCQPEPEPSLQRDPELELSFQLGQTVVVVGGFCDWSFAETLANKFAVMVRLW